MVITWIFFFNLVINEVAFIIIQVISIVEFRTLSNVRECRKCSFPATSLKLSALE